MCTGQDRPRARADCCHLLVQVLCHGGSRQITAEVEAEGGEDHWAYVVGGAGLRTWVQHLQTSFRSISGVELALLLLRNRNPESTYASRGPQLAFPANTDTQYAEKNSAENFLPPLQSSLHLIFKN